MPIVAIAIVLALLVALVVAAVGPALRIAERRALGGEIEDLAFAPVEWRSSAERVTPRRFVPARVAQHEPAAPIVSGRRGA